MKYICLDLEMSEAKGNKQRKNLHGLRNEIIEIGAVMLDSNFNYLGCISIPVKPEHTSVTEFITELTGITNKSLAEADSLRMAFRKYMAWVGKGDVITFCWGENDFSQLWDELYIKIGFVDKYVSYLKNFIDLQAIFGYSIGTKSRFSLDSAIKTVGCKFVGQRHSALGDAINTTRILYKIAKEKTFDIERGKMYGKVSTLYGARFNRYNLNIENSIAMEAFFPEGLFEKYNLQPRNLDEPQNSDWTMEDENYEYTQTRFDVLAKKFFPKAIYVKYKVPVKKYFIFRAKMSLRKDLNCKDIEIINS